MEGTWAPADAARELRELARHDLALRQRMEGIVWIVLGLTATTLFFGYAFAIIEGVPVGALAFLWLPWTAAGGAVVWALRRSLSLAAPLDPRASWTWLFLGAGAVSLVAIAALVVGGRETAPSFALLALGLLALGPALAPAMGYTPLGRRVGLALGGLGVVAGLVLLLASPEGTWSTWAGAGVCLAWVVGGVYQILQG